MRGRPLSSTFVAIIVLCGSMAAGWAPAAPSAAAGLEEAAAISVPSPTHLEFMTRAVPGKGERVYALLGSRDVGTPLDDAGAPIAHAPQGGLNLFDVSDPEAPAFVLNVPCKIPRDDVGAGNQDVAVVTLPEPLVIEEVAYDTVVAIGSNEVSGCTIDGVRGGSVQLVALRAEPLPGQDVTARFLGWDRAWGQWGKIAHTVVAHPHQPVIYASNQEIGDRFPSVEIIDLRAWPPKLTSHVILPNRVTSGVGPHDIQFNPEGTRAYVSAISVSYVWDTGGDKLFAPEVLGVIDAPNLKVHHEAALHPDGRHVLVVDETIASSDPVNVPVCPGGGVHVFDLGANGEFETVPVPVGQFYAQDLSVVPPEIDAEGQTAHNEVSCTAHEFTISPDGSSMTIGWYIAGVRVLDLSALGRAATQAAPTPVALTETGYFVVDGNEVWAAKTHPSVPGYVFVSDTGGDAFRVLRATATP